MIEEDDDSLRLLWNDDLTAGGLPYVLQMLVHISGAEDSTTCANYTKQRITWETHKK